MQRWYFVKKSESDDSFYGTRSDSEIRERLANGQIETHWLVTLDHFGESYQHLIQEPRTPVNWITVGALVSQSFDTRVFPTGFAPPARSQVRPASMWSFEGRISRGEFWAVWLGTAFACFLVGFITRMLLGADTSVGGMEITGVLSLVAIAISTWIGVAAQVKRWHDRNKSGWMVLVNLIPLAGWIWTFLELGCRPGTKWDNPYGADPLY